MSSSDSPTRIVSGIHPETLLFLITWILFSSAGPLLFVGDLFRMKLVEAVDLYRVVCTVQVFVLIFFFPLLLSSRSFLGDCSTFCPEDKAETERERNFSLPIEVVRAVRYLLFTLVVVLLGLPFVYIACDIGNVSLSTLLTGQFQVIGLILGTGGIWWGVGRANTDWVRYFFFILVCLALIVPLIYAGLKQIMGVEPSWLLIVSPVTVAVGTEGTGGMNPRIVHGTVSIIAGIFIGVVLYVSRGRSMNCRSGNG